MAGEHPCHGRPPCGPRFCNAAVSRPRQRWNTPIEPQKGPNKPQPALQAACERLQQARAAAATAPPLPAAPFGRSLFRMCAYPGQLAQLQRQG